MTPYKIAPKIKLKYFLLATLLLFALDSLDPNGPLAQLIPCFGLGPNLPFLVNAKSIQVFPGNGTLNSAMTSSDPGDILNMDKGNFFGSGCFVVDTSITI